MHGVDTVNVSLRRDFGARLSRLRESHGGRSHREDFYTVARELFERYALEGEELRDFMTRAARLLKKPRHPDSTETKTPAHNPTIEMSEEARSEGIQSFLDSIQGELLDEVSEHPEHNLDIRPKLATRRYPVRPWKEIDGEILPPDGTE